MSTMFDSVHLISKKMGSFSASKRGLDLGFKLGPDSFQASALTTSYSCSSYCIFTLLLPLCFLLVEKGGPLTLGSDIDENGVVLIILVSSMVLHFFCEYAGLLKVTLTYS